MGCSGFTGDLILPEKLETIGKSAFASCYNLSGTLTIPSSVKEIRDSAFFGCIGFDDVKFKNSDVRVEVYAFYRLHIQCFQDPPSYFKNDDQQIFKSENFGGKILGDTPLKFDCRFFRAIDNIIYYCVLLGGSGAGLIVLTIVTQVLAVIYSNIHRLSAIFSLIIKDERENYKDETEIRN